MNVAQHTRKPTGDILLDERRKLYRFYVSAPIDGGERTLCGTVDGFRLADHIETRLLARCRQMRPDTSIHATYGKTQITVARLR